MSDKKECNGEMIPANINDILEELPEDKRAADFGMPSSNC